MWFLPLWKGQADRYHNGSIVWLDGYNSSNNRLRILVDLE